MEPKKPFKMSSFMLWTLACAIFGFGIGVYHGYKAGLCGFGITISVAVVVVGIIRAFEEDRNRTD